MHTDHDAPPNSDVNPEALKQGFEPDKVNVRTILYVPVAILVTFVLAYVVVTLIVTGLREGPKKPAVDLPAAKRNEAAVNDRFTRVNDPNSNTRQPRLEGLERRLDTTQPPFVLSSVPTKEGNSPYYHPEDLRTTSKHAKELGLQDFGWKDKSKNIVRIPIAEAIKVMSAWENEKNSGDKDIKKAAAEKLKKFGFDYEDKVDLQAISAGQPTASNPQLGIIPADRNAKPKGGEH